MIKRIFMRIVLLLEYLQNGRDVKKCFKFGRSSEIKGKGYFSILGQNEIFPIELVNEKFKDRNGRRKESGITLRNGNYQNRINFGQRTQNIIILIYLHYRTVIHLVDLCLIEAR